MNCVTIPGQSFIYSVVNYLVNKMMKSSLRSGSYIHTRSFSDCFETFKYLYLVRSVFSFNFFFDEQIDLPMCMKGAVTGEIRGLFKVFTPRYLSAEHNGKEKASNVVGYILAVLADTYERSTLNAHVQKAMEYIDNHITEPLSLEDVAAMLHLTREYTAALFKRETGMTVTQYINNRKLSRASDLIREEGNDLAEIAKSLGYKNYTYFSSIFKKHFGVSPSQFRK